jgi:hypothetical protein
LPFLIRAFNRAKYRSGTRVSNRHFCAAILSMAKSPSRLYS